MSTASSRDAAIAAERRRRREERMTADLASQVADQVAQRITQAPEARPAASTAQPRHPAQDAPPPTPPAPAPAAAAPGADDATDARPEVVQLDRDAYERLVAAANAPQTAARDLARSKLEQTVEAAVRDGRIPPARRESWIKAIQADPTQADVLAGLDKGLVPLEEIGHSGDGSDQPTRDDLWFPDHTNINRR